uniref:Nck-associated protein 5 C-terminal domain-containing protein n=1 Tax=Monopterus albus TaxID=43700 RepID=A0A3Q3KFX3_MONAL
MHTCEKLIHELEEERRLRLESEKRLREVTEESELGRAQMVSLQQQFSRMEETVRSLLQNQGILEQTAVGTVDIMKAYKFCAALALNVSVWCLQEENSALATENESQREQYERCLDEVSVHLVYLDLREECLKLRTRVFDLEQQNRALSILFQQKIKPASDLLLQSSLTWEKRLSLGSSAPSNICAPVEEQLPTRHKESHILEGLKKLQSRKHRSSSSSSKVSKSGYKDCMNSNEGIYSLGIKSSSKGVSKPTHVGRTSAAGGKKFSYDSDDADDELVHSGHGVNIPTKDSWLYCKRRFHSISDSLCSWDGIQDSGGGGNGNSGAVATKHPSGYDSKERPEKLMSFINSFLPEGGQASAFTKPSRLHFSPSEPEGSNHLSDVDDPGELKSESTEIHMSFSLLPLQAERDSKRLSWDASKLLAQQCLQRDQGQTQSADERPRPISVIKEPKEVKCTHSEESKLVIFDVGESIGLCSQKLAASPVAHNDIQASKVVADYTELVPQDKPTRQKSANVRNYAVLESPEKPSDYQTGTSKASSSREGSAERLSMQLTPQRTLIKPPNSQVNKGHSIPPMNDSAGPKSSGSMIPGHNKPSGSPLRLSKGSTTQPNNSGNSGPSGQEKSPSSPTVKMSKFIKTPGNCSQSPKVVNPKLPGKADWSKGSSSSSIHLSRRHLEYADNGEQPSRDTLCETSKNKLRSPSPPPPPGRSTSLLIRPNYEGSPLAHKTGVAQPSTPTTVRGPPPSYYTSLAPNMQTTLPIKDKDCLDLDAGYGTALAPQKLVDKTSQHLQESPALTQTSTKGTTKRMTTKDYLPSANSGCAPESENAPKNSKNVPPPYSDLRGSALQKSFAHKKESSQEKVHQTVQESTISLPVSLQKTTQGKPEPQNGKAVVSPPSSVMISPKVVEKASKTRIPMGFKAFLKSPPSHKNSSSIPDKQEKDHINSVSKETVTSNISTQCDSLQPVYSIDSAPKMPITEGKVEAQSGLLEEDVHAAVLQEDGGVCDKGKRSSHLFSRSISVTTKPHLKPALGMNGAKARSQSFSTNYIEKPNTSVIDGPGKMRTQIITNSGERGNSLSRQSSLEVPSFGSTESPVHSPRTRLSHYGGMSRMSKSGSKGEGSPCTVKGEVVTSPSQKEMCTLPISDRIGSNNIHKPANVASHPEFQPPSPCVYSSENPVRETGGIATTTSEPDFSKEIKSQTNTPNKLPNMEDKKISPTACTIEEKVMMGIEENVQKCQEQEKVAANETKQKTGPSLANWFGLRKSKLPALSGKKADSPKGKEEKKELKIGSVLGGKQMKSDKKKDKKKNENQQKDSQELLFLLIFQALIMTQKIKLRAENEEGHIPDTTCQDHMIGSSCQMRTLDSGIGTFPLPDSVTRAGSRHIPKSESSPDGMTAGSAELNQELPSCYPDPSQPDVKVMGHSLSDSTVTCSSNSQNTQSQLPKLATSGEWTTCSSDEICHLITNLACYHERVLLVCTYSGSSSDTETEPEGTGSTLGSPQRTLISRTKKRDSGQAEISMKLFESFFPVKTGA